MSEIVSIHQIPQIEPDHGLYFDRHLKVDRAQLLVNAAHESVYHNRNRLNTNFMLSELARHNGLRFASSLIMHASLLELSDIDTDDKPVEADLWLGVEKNGAEIRGAVLVQRDVTVVDAFGEIVVDQGTCVEGWVTDAENQGIAELYRSGQEVAEHIANGQQVFSIEPDPTAQSWRDRMFSGKRSAEQTFLGEIGRVYAFKQTSGLYRRLDMPIKKLVQATVFTN